MNKRPSRLTLVHRPDPVKSALASSIAAGLALFSVSAHAGTFTLSPFTGDADSGLTAGGAYTHAFNIGGTGNLTVNGAVFTGSGGGGNPSTNNYSVGNMPGIFGGFGSGLGGNIATALSDFVYGGNPGLVTLNNLRVGQEYETVFYNAAFGPAGGRFTTVTANGLDSFFFDQNSTPGSLLTYRFIATSATMTYSLSPSSPGDTFHNYAFTNRIVGYNALLTDNFYAPEPTNPNTNDVNFNVAVRQGGSLVAGGGPITYTPAGNNQVGNNTGGIDGGSYLLNAFGGTTAINHNFNGADSAGGLSISFDFAPNSTGNGDTTLWQAINLGLSDPNKNAGITDPAPHFGILFRGNGGIEAWDGNSIITSAGSWGPGSTNALHHIELLLTDPSDSNPFDGLGQTDIAVFADGALIFNYTKAGGGYADNFLNFSNVFIGGVDNVMVAQIPEPASFALLGLGGLALLRRRRQNAI